MADALTPKDAEMIFPQHLPRFEETEAPLSLLKYLAEFNDRILILFCPYYGLLLGRCLDSWTAPLIRAAT